MNYYPIFLDLRGRPCLVVGGAEIATRQVEGLLRTGAAITVISPKLSESLQHYADAGELRHLNRRYKKGDLKGIF